MIEFKIGKSCGIYDVLYECDYKDRYGKRLYRVRCRECGWETDCRKIDVCGFSQKCSHVSYAGRYRRYIAKNGWNDKRLEVIYKGMRGRCYNEKNPNYRYYGGKGVRIYDGWLDEPESFEDWAIDNGYEEGLSIDRIDPDGDYSPSNCRWVSGEDNARYKSTTRNMKMGDGEVYSGRELAKRLHIGTNAINKMMRKYPEEKVMEFVNEREKNMNKKRSGKMSWFEVYGIEV